jgi:hypothetical protein
VRALGEDLASWGGLISKSVLAARTHVVDPTDLPQVNRDTKRRRSPKQVVRNHTRSSSEHRGRLLRRSPCSQMRPRRDPHTHMCRPGSERRGSSLHRPQTGRSLAGNPQHPRTRPDATSDSFSRQTPTLFIAAALRNWATASRESVLTPTPSREKHPICAMSPMSHRWGALRPGERKRPFHPSAQPFHREDPRPERPRKILHVHCLPTPRKKRGTPILPHTGMIGFRYHRASHHYPKHPPPPHDTIDVNVQSPHIVPFGNVVAFLSEYPLPLSE